MLQAGQIQKLKVLRKTDIAYLLVDNDQNEVFLHVNESNHTPLSPNEEVEVFLYYDAKGRISATLSKPLIMLEKPAVLKVIGITPGLGVFLDMGIAKDLLLSKDYLPFNQDLWPTLNDQVYVKLEAGSRLTAKPLKDDEISSVIGNLPVPSQTTGFVQMISKIGLFIYTDEGNLILVKNANFRGQYRLGQTVNVSIKYLSQAGYEGSLVLGKEYLREDDAQIIVDYLKENNGKMPYTATTDAETITDIFNLSRKAFKRALGLLYKDRTIYFEGEYTILKED